MSLSVSYAIATPLVGLADDNCHGGSIVITSNSLLPCSYWYLISLSNWNDLTLAVHGIQKI